MKKIGTTILIILLILFIQCGLQGMYEFFVGLLNF